jgi:hypothetical protein
MRCTELYKIDTRSGKALNDLSLDEHKAWIKKAIESKLLLGCRIRTDDKKYILIDTYDNVHNFCKNLRYTFLVKGPAYPLSEINHIWGISSQKF